MVDTDTPIFGFNRVKPDIVEEVVRRVTSQVRDPLMVLSDASYHEIRRLSASESNGALHEWRALARHLGRMSDSDCRQKIEELARRYAWDVAGNFEPKVYRIVSRLGVPIVSGFLSPRATVKNFPANFELTSLDARIHVQGPREHIRRLSRLGTLVFVPTHLSNLDSVVFGFAMERSGFPPATYGAGKNLFTNPVLSFFMHNLGAYRVDRRLRHALYKDVLKAYSCVLIERGFHSLFFPGGTRSRSGGVERRLKLGLAGTGLEAFVRTTLRGSMQRVFFIPATINYLLTLEAETLIDDYLQEEGKQRYIIEDDESTRMGRIAAFVNKLLGLDASCVIRFGQPLDCFGNLVDDEGRSFDPRGRIVDATSFIRGIDDVVSREPTREARYTKELGDAICDHFKKDTVAMATHVASAAAFQHLVRTVGQADLFAMLRHRGDVRVAREELAADIDRLMKRARQLDEKGELVLASSVKSAAGDRILDEALRAFAGYHTHEVLAPRGTELLLADPRLLLYYQNRLVAHGLAHDPSSAKPRAA